MGSNANPNAVAIIIIIVYMISCSILSPMLVHCSSSYYSIEDLEDLIRTYASRANWSQPTGSQRRIKLPANLPGMEASMVMLRFNTFWKRGANVSHVYIPSKVKTTPYAKRIALVYDNLGNWSSQYYRVPNHSFISPAIGFSIYDASDPSHLANKSLNLSITSSDRILINFSSLVHHGHKNATLKCVTFGASNTTNTSFKLTNTTGTYRCSTTRSSGHFALVAITSQFPPKHKRKTTFKWWLVVLPVVGFLVSVMVGAIAFELFRKKKIREMEEESEKGIAIGSVWIGRSRMPSADMVRTQPSLEHQDHAPAGPSLPL